MTTSRRIAHLAGVALEAKTKAQLVKELTFAEMREIAASALSQTQDNSTRPPPTSPATRRYGPKKVVR